MSMSGRAKPCIAVVDDDESLCSSFARLLRAAGMQPSTYLSAEEFLADRDHKRFACLVLDIQLSGMSGLSLQSQLTAAGTTVPVIFITAHDDPQTRVQAMAAGCVGYFRKTDSGSDVLDAIRRVVAQHPGSGE